MRILKVLEASTGNVSEQTARFLDYLDADTGIEPDLPITYVKGGYGWWVRVNPDRADQSKVPADLLGVISFAHQHGCEWVMFDCDADPIEGLPFYDW